MDVLISDNAKAEISERVKDILRTFMIKDWQSEAYNKNQNFAERGWQDTKAKANALLNWCNAPKNCWLLALKYICFVLNHTAHESLNWRTPIKWLLGHTPDISVLLQFFFWEPVYYMKEDVKWGESTECLGRMVGISETVGHAMTYLVLTASGNIISRAVLRSATKEGAFINRRADADAGDLVPRPVEPTPFSNPAPRPQTDGEDQDPSVFEANPAKTKEAPTYDTTDEEGGLEDIPSTDEENSPFTPITEHLELSEEFIRSVCQDKVEKGETLPDLRVDDLLGRTFITEPDKDYQQQRARILSVESEGLWTPDGTARLYKFKAKVGDKTFEHLVTYNKMLEWCDKDLQAGDMYKLRGIIGHRRNPANKRKWQLLIDWESGEPTWNDFTTTWESDPVTVAMYAKKYNMLDVDGWKRCRRIIRNEKTLARMINQTKLRNFRLKPAYKYGYQVPRSHEEAMWIDEEAGNSKWAKSEALEVSQLLEYDSFEDLGKGAPIPDGYQKIPCHFVYDIKHDG